MEDTVEVSRSRLSLLENVGKLANELWNDDKIGLVVKERFKEKHPDANVPEVVIAQNSRKVEQEILSKVEAKEKAVDEKISHFEKTWKEKEEAENKRKAEQEFAAEVDAAKKKYQLTAEGMEKVFARMKEKNNPDVEAAAAWVTDHEVKTPTSTSSFADPMFNPFGSRGEDKAWELLNRNPFDGKFAEQEIAKIQNDFASGRAHLYGPNGMGGEL